MKILQPEYWVAKFWDKKNRKYKGFVFEDLVESILNRGFAGTWTKTQMSHDGGRDVEYTNQRGEAQWAECKIRKEKLTTFDISKTLVMAVNNQINLILVFSYSPLVPSAIMHLSDFANRTKKKILVIDDNNLEKLILKHLNDEQLNHFFPTFNNEYKLQTAPDLTIGRFVSEDVGLSRYQFNNYDEDRERNISSTADIGRYYLYEFYFSSNLDVESDLMIDFSEFYSNQSKINTAGVLNLDEYLKDNKDDWKLLSPAQNEEQHIHKYIRKIAPYEVFNIRLYFQPIGHIETLPSIRLTYNDKNYSSEPLKIKVRKDIAIPEYIGITLIRLLDKIEQERTNYKRSKFYLVAGNSGVGKSRFIYEVIGRLLKLNYNIYSIDSSSDSRMSNFSYFLIELLTLIFKIPSPHIAGPNVDVAAMFTANKRESRFNNTMCNIVLKCLKNHKFSYTEIDNEILPCIFNGFLKTKSVLFVDNVQYLDQNSVYLLSKLINIRNATTLCSVFYIFNIETLNHTSPAGYLYYDLNSEDTIYIGDFKADNIEQFINSAIRLSGGEPFSKAHRHLYNNIVKNIPHRPFYLHQFISELDQKEIIKIHDNYMYIHDIEKLNSLLFQLSEREVDILDIRFKNLKSEYRASIELLKYTGSIDVNFAKSNFNNLLTQEIMNNLIRWKFLKAENGKISFVHSIMEKYVLEKDLKIDSKHKALLKDIFLKKRIIKLLYPLAVFSYLPSMELFDEVLSVFEDNCIPSDRNAFYADHILSFIYDQDSKTCPDQYICMVDNLAVLSSKNNKAHYVNILENFYKLLKYYIPSNKIKARAYIEIIREYGSFLTVYNRYGESIQVLEEGVNRLKRLNIDNTLYLELKSRLLNRIGVAHKQHRNLSKALMVTETALTLAQESGSIVMQALSYIDLGYISYGDRTQNEILLKNWDQAVKLYENSISVNNDIFDRDTALACKLTKIMTIGIRNDLNEAIKLASEFIDDAKSKASAYYELQGNRVAVFFRFMFDYKNEHIIVDLDKLITLSTRYKIYKYCIFAYHLKALYYIKRGEDARASAEFNTIVNLIDNDNFINNVSIEIWFLLNDIKTFYSKYGNDNIKLECPSKLIDLERRLQGYNFPNPNDSMYYDGEYCFTLP